MLQTCKFVPLIRASHFQHLLLTPCLANKYHCQYMPIGNASHIPLVTNDMCKNKQRLNVKGICIPNGKGHTRYCMSTKMCGSWQQKGCQCGFVVKTFYLKPSVAKATYHSIKYVNLKVFSCHGATKIGHKSRFSSHLSLEVQEFITSQLLMDVCK